MSFKIEDLEIPKFRTKFVLLDNEYVLNDIYRDKIKDFKNFEVRNDDIFIATFPKSGTTWLQEIVYLIMNDCNFDKVSEQNIDLRVPLYEFPTPGLEEIKKMPSPRIIKTHLPKSCLPDNIEKKCKVRILILNH
jgi:hypothetical protein